MSFIEIVLLAVGLSMDSLAVSVAGGALIQNYKHHHMLKIGCVMGGFQAGMTIAGYLAGLSFKKYITAFDHWIAFLLLLYLGGKMIYESTKEEEKIARRTRCATRHFAAWALRQASTLWQSAYRSPASKQALHWKP